MKILSLLPIHLVAGAILPQIAIDSEFDIVNVIDNQIAQIEHLPFPTSVGFVGYTKTASPPFLAQTNQYPQKTGIPSLEEIEDYVLPNPIETGSQSFDHSSDDETIHHYFGTISPYRSDGWGVFEYGLPETCKIVQAHMLSRHGARYPISLGRSRTIVNTLTKENIASKVKNFTGNLTFLNSWDYTQGNSILTTLGNQQLFDKGSKMFYRYGGLYNFSSSNKIVVRSTSQSRMANSALYFLNGFFGLQWQNYADLDLIIESKGYNNTMSPKGSCPNFAQNNVDNGTDRILISKYARDYLKASLQSLNSQVDRLDSFKGDFFGYNDMLRLQELCAYEVNNLGSSRFCSLFSQSDWENYEYIHDWSAYNHLLLPNTKASKALGMGWVEEFRSRLMNSPFNKSRQTSQNLTLDTSKTYFPLNQTLYFDFSHDTTMVNILHAMGFNFETDFSGRGPQYDKIHNEFYFELSKVVPFAAQIVFEVIECDTLIPNDRSVSYSKQHTKYIHMLLNDRTIPLHDHFPTICEGRLDGWCDFYSFTSYLDSLWETTYENGKLFNDVCYS